MVHSTNPNLRALSPALVPPFENLNSNHLVTYNLDREIKMAVQDTNHKLTEYPARFVTMPSRMQPNMKAAEKSLGNPFLVNYAYDYLIT